ncbi:MAG TPA: hypothetical protein DCS08_01655 [Candidatus Moranbacteria bacterium]|nr:hypothetical protein [Candidatus Moranbacteria bacterium]
MPFFGLNKEFFSYLTFTPHHFLKKIILIFRLKAKPLYLKIYRLRKFPLKMVRGLSIKFSISFYLKKSAFCIFPHPIK